LQNINLEALLESLHDGVYFTDLERRITFWNRSAEKITGFCADDVVGSCCYDNILVHVDRDGNSLCLGHCPLAATMADGVSREAEVYLHHKAGHRVPVSVRVSPMRDDRGAIVGGVELFSDISGKYALELRTRELESLAMFDALTGLSNRAHLQAELDARLQERDRYRLSFGLVFLDVDRFKDFNDRYGHEIGDRVLQTVAETLRQTARPFDLFGRWGGEEFVGIIRNIDAPGLRAIADRVRRLIEGSTIAVPGGRERVTVSVGATLVRPDDGTAGLVNRADSLMYLSKKLGRNRETCDFHSSSKKISCP